MLGRKITALIMALAMVMSTAVFIYADNGTAADNESAVAAEPADKADQVINVAAEKKVVVGRADKIDAELVTGDGALTFESSNTKAVTVNKTGKIKAVGVGEAIITITAAETKSFNAAVAEVKVTVVPKAVTVTSLTCRKHGKFTIKWKKLKKVSGFEVQCCKSKSFKKNVKSKKVKNGKATGATVTNLKKAKFYVRVRVYKTVDGVKYYSDWSKIKSVKVK